MVPRSSAHTPAPLRPYLLLAPPSQPHSLNLVTSILGTSPSWLVLRAIAEALAKDDERHAAEVVLGIPLSTITPPSRLQFVDGVTALFSSTSPPAAPLPSPSSETQPLPPLRTATLAALRAAILPLLSPTKRTLLVLDGLDLLPACTSPAIPAHEVSALLVALRSRAHATLVTLSADSALSVPDTPLGANHAAIVALAAHQARWVLQVRGLDTGGARDVGGVIRVGRGGGWDWGEMGGEDGEDGEEGGDDGEWLFHVGGDGGVKVWRRGEGSGSG
ncbi:MAG: hypothetical protein M1833_000731 [Piccolia ochrophora]|nr:MAG: hypothetical protein M1833_000731 [Piccolia ochrophora]